MEKTKLALLVSTLLILVTSLLTASFFAPYLFTLSIFSLMFAFYCYIDSKNKELSMVLSFLEEQGYILKQSKRLKVSKDQKDFVVSYSFSKGKINYLSLVDDFSKQKQTILCSHN